MIAIYFPFPHLVLFFFFFFFLMNHVKFKSHSPPLEFNGHYDQLQLVFLSFNRGSN